MQGEDLGPLELKIESMQKQVMTSVDECNRMQQFWLRQQNDLVKKTRSSEEQRKEIDHLEKQLLVMHQRKIRIDGDPSCSTKCHRLILIDCRSAESRGAGQVAGGTQHSVTAEGHHQTQLPHHREEGPAGATGTGHHTHGE